MRIVYFVFATLMIVFAAVQYNDPDGPFWAGIYAVPAVFAAIAALRPSWLSGFGLVLLGLAAFGAAAGTVYYWPKEVAFWRQDVWWNSETAREGMGMMIILAGLLLILCGRLVGRRSSGS
ncbi:MAG: transmembrane 220 family protein [Pseudomonadota bacterium]